MVIVVPFIAVTVEPYGITQPGISTLSPNWTPSVETNVIVLEPATVPVASVWITTLFSYMMVENWFVATPFVDSITFKSSSKSLLSTL